MKVDSFNLLQVELLDKSKSIKINPEHVTSVHVSPKLTVQNGKNKGEFVHRTVINFAEYGGVLHIPREKFAALQNYFVTQYGFVECRILFDREQEAKMQRGETVIGDIPYRCVVNPKSLYLSDFIENPPVDVITDGEFRHVYHLRFIGGMQGLFLFKDLM